jgi:hypothetical protein
MGMPEEVDVHVYGWSRVGYCIEPDLVHEFGVSLLRV